MKWKKPIRRAHNDHSRGRDVDHIHDIVQEVVKIPSRRHSISDLATHLLDTDPTVDGPNDAVMAAIFQSMEAYVCAPQQEQTTAT